MSYGNETPIPGERHNMAITLRPEHEKLVAKAMQTGAYENSEEVIRRALEMLHCEDEWLRAQRANR
jgi:Arc/MetJ-type ribon-helix-helix transcriptional regulator